MTVDAAVRIQIPVTTRGRRSARQEEEYRSQVEAFCEAIQEINSRLNFKVSSRGWCYILEEYGLNKGAFDTAQRLIVDCRKKGLLPLDIVAEDTARQTECLENGYRDFRDPEEQAQYIVDEMVDDTLWRAESYTPKWFWETQEHYVEILVEKIDLKNLFYPVCSRYYVPITNARGWSDVNSRAAIMRRFEEREKRGLQCVLLYCGDHDPGGLSISGFIRSNMADLSDAVHWSPENLIIDRFGLNYDFIVENNLSWVDNLQTSSSGQTKIGLDDPRHRDHNKPYVQDYLQKYGARKVEANALVVRPEAGRELCERAISRYIDPETVNMYENFVMEQRALVRQHIIQKLRERNGE